MKILLLADANSAHVIKWAKSLASEVSHIQIFSLKKYTETIYSDYSNIFVYSLGFDNYFKKSNGRWSKLIYLTAVSKLKKVINEFKPDILHAHYASSYGLLGSLSRFQPYIISVWGTDVFDFPNISCIHKRILKYSLSKANKILSTSQVMAIETQKYTPKNITVTPFGIDLTVFKAKQVESFFNEGDIVIGTIKSLEENYGIEYLIKAFKILSEKYPLLPLKLLIAGTGSLEKELKQICKNLNIYESVIFTGKIPYHQVSIYHNMIDIYVALSKRESFGVAIIEASACEKTVVVSNVGGLPEVVENNVTGLIVPPENPKEAAWAIEKLVLDKKMRIAMGKAGRERVKKLFDWNDNVKQMKTIYQTLFTQQKNYSNG